MSDTVIRVENLSKRYRIGGNGAHFKYGSLRDSLANAAKAPFRRLRQANTMDSNPQYIWALKDVSFEVQRGEVVGIIGRNGAGKTTLLKILSRITRPTEGHVRMRGRVGSLLEVGTGFHPELTGRENIYLNGAVLGMKRAEINSKFDEIVDFSEIEDFLDTPVKHYSSGMYMRLAFAVAAHLEPEILLVDEVLAVGDTAFQKKCLGKMGEIAKEGRTVLFVSHNMGAIGALCKQGIFINRGHIYHYGDIDSCVKAYLLFGVEDNLPFTEIEKVPELPIQLLAVSVVNKFDELINNYPFNDPVYVKIKMIVRKSITKVYLAVHIHDSDLSTLMFSRDFESNNNLLFERNPGVYTYLVEIPPSVLVPSRYRVSVHVARSIPPQLINGIDYVCPFEIIDAGSTRSAAGFPWIGKIAIPMKWTCTGIRGISEKE